MEGRDTNVNTTWTQIQEGTKEQNKNMQSSEIILHADCRTSLLTRYTVLQPDRLSYSHKETTITPTSTNLAWLAWHESTAPEGSLNRGSSIGHPWPSTHRLPTCSLARTGRLFVELTPTLWFGLYRFTLSSKTFITAQHIQDHTTSKRQASTNRMSYEVVAKTTASNS